MGLFSGVQKLFSGDWNGYYEDGIIPNIWKGMTGQTSADRNTEATNQANQDIANQTNAINKQIADENLGYQREMLDYQKALQQQIFEREDTSYQRTANDMIAAGLNPLDMQGTNGAGELISTSPLNNSFQAQQPNAMQVAPTMGNLGQIVSAIGSISSAINGTMTGSLERDSIALDNDRKLIENEILAHDHGLNIFGKGKNRSVGMSYIGNNDYDWSNSKGWKNSENLEKLNNAYIERMNKQREYEHKASAGIYDSDTDFERILTAISDWINNGRGEAEWKKLQDTFPILKLGR